MMLTTTMVFAALIAGQTGVNPGIEGEAFAGPRVERASLGDGTRMGFAEGRGGRRAVGEGRFGAERFDRPGRRRLPLTPFRAGFDVNEDGRLTAEERAAFSEAYPAYREVLIASYDLNEDGRLSREEWGEAVRVLGLEVPERPEPSGGPERFPADAGTASERPRGLGLRGERPGLRGVRLGESVHERLRERMLERFDADGSGDLSLEERAEARAAIESRGIVRRLERLDRDANGVISAEEVEAANEFIAERAAKLRERAEERGFEGGPRGPLEPRR